MDPGYSLTPNKYLTKPEQARLEEILQKFKSSDPRNTTLIWLAIKCGARPQEVLNLSWQDFNNDTRSVFIKSLKGGKNRSIPLPKWLFDRIMNLKPEGLSDESAKVFDIGYNMYNIIWRQFRPVKKKLHSLRHTFAVNLYEKSKYNLRLVQLALGHKNMPTTAIYLEIEMSKDALSQALLG